MRRRYIHIISNIGFISKCMSDKLGALSLSDKLGASDFAVLATRTLGDARAVNVRQVTLCCSRERRHRARAALFEITNLRPAALNRYMLIGLRGKGHPFPRPADSRPGCVGHASVHAFADPVFGGARARALC